MATAKSVFGVIGALVPVVYCGGLLYYFLDTTGSVNEAKTNGLGPTLLGLATVGLLFCIPLILKIARLFLRPRSPGSSPDAPEDGFDADAMIARYKSRQSENAPAGGPPERPLRGGAAKRPSFGRAIR